MTFVINELNDLELAAERIIQNFEDHRVIIFNGEMGAGKTTFIKAICKRLGVKDVVSSPTFSIVNEYESTDGPIFHFDFYRIKSQREAMDIGFDDYIYTGNFCLIEWPEKIPDLLPASFIQVDIEIISPSQRTITMSKRPLN